MLRFCWCSSLALASQVLITKRASVLWARWRIQRVTNPLLRVALRVVVNACVRVGVCMFEPELGQCMRAWVGGVV